MTKPFNRRTRERILAVSFIVLLGIFVLRLVQVQAYDGPRWKSIARKQSLQYKYQRANRGEIRDRNGIALAVTLPLAYAVGYRRTEGVDRDHIASVLAAHLQKPKKLIRAKLDGSDFIYLARRVDWQVRQDLENSLTESERRCLQFDEESRRAYPAATSAAALIGYANVDGQGMEGVEALMDDELSGAGFRELCRVDAFRQEFALVAPPPVEYQGAHVTLTLDLQLQAIVDEQLEAQLARRTCERACVVMVEPATGDILAMATYPAFNLNQPGDADPAARRCWPITDVIEPGSTLKIAALSLALESGKFNRQSRIFCENGSYRVRGATIRDAHPHGDLSFDEVLGLSSNIGTVKIAERFTPSEIYDKLRAFGFGNSTQIGIAGEQSGSVPHPKRWTGPTQATLVFGHGMSCTPLQLAMAYASIANGGLLLKPRLIKSVNFPVGSPADYPVEVVRRVMPASIAAELTDMLVRAVESGTGKQAGAEGIRIAGKTGTAEKVDHERRTYFTDRYVSSFAGFFPAENPRYVVLIIIDDPKGEYYGGVVAAPIFRGIAEEIRALRPGEIAPSTGRSSPVLVDRGPESGTVALASAFPAAPRPAHPVPAVRMADNDTTMVCVPLVEGLPLRKAAQELAARRFDVRLSGSGRVTAQNPPAGSWVPIGTVCVLSGAGAN